MRNSRQASCAGLRSTAMTRSGFRVNRASVLSPAEAMDTHTLPGLTSSASTSTSASSQHWAYRMPAKLARPATSVLMAGVLRAREPRDVAASAIQLDRVAVFEPRHEAGDRHDRGDAKLTRNDRRV